MKTRRYALPENEAETVKLALRISLESMESIKRESPYAKWQFAKMEELLSKLELYQWRI